MARSTRPMHVARLTTSGRVYLLLMLCMLAAAFVQKVNLLILLVGMLTAPMPLAFLLSHWNLLGLEVRRRLPDEVFAREAFVLGYEIRSTHRWSASLGIEIEDESAKGLSIEPAVVPLPPIAPGEAARVEVSGLAERRGRYELGRLRLRSAFPFGFFVREISVESDDAVVAFPRRGVLSMAWPAAARSGRSIARERRGGGQPGREDYHHLREFRVGEDPRRIHWRASAKRGKLIAKEHEPAGAEETLLVVDPWVGRERDSAEELELLLSLAASLASELATQRDGRLAFAVADRSPFLVAGTASRTLVDRFLFELATLQGSRTTDLSIGLREAACLVQPGARVYLLSNRPREEAEAALAQRRTLGTSSHVLLSALDAEGLLAFSPPSELDPQRKREAV